MYSHAPQTDVSVNDGSHIRRLSRTIIIKVKVKCTLVQALRLCTGRTAHRGSRVIAVLFLDHGIRRVRGQRHALAALYPRGKPGTHCTGDWVGPRAGLDRYGKSRPNRDSIPDCPASSSVAIPTELRGPHNNII